MSLDLTVTGDAEEVADAAPNSFADSFPLPDVLGERAPNVTVDVNATCLLRAALEGEWEQTSGCFSLSVLWDWLARPVSLSLWPLELTLPWDSPEAAARDVVNATTGVVLPASASAAAEDDSATTVDGGLLALAVLLVAVLALAMGVCCAHACSSGSAWCRGAGLWPSPPPKGVRVKLVRV